MTMPEIPATPSHTEIVDWFDTVLPMSWSRRIDGESESAAASFHRYTDPAQRATIVVDDGTVMVTEYGPFAWEIVAETTLSGDPRRQAPRALAIVGVTA